MTLPTPRLSVALPLFLVLSVVAVVAADWWTCLPEGRQAEYVGRQSCVRCHAKQIHEWKDSPHDKAMEPATEDTVLGNFDNQELTHFGVTSRMFRRDGKFMVHTEGRDGTMQDFEVKYTFGYDPLQQYMVEFPDGRVQVLSVAWDTKKKRWYHLYQDERIPAGDWLHWTGGGQNWNYMCAECHSTNLQKNYNLNSDTYHTTFSEIDVSCESCHGPGSLHIELAEEKSLFWDRRYGYGLAKLKDKSSKAQLESCARCHSRRRIVHPGFEPGREFLDYYEPQLIDDDLYFPDGQIHDEVYVYGSFLQSLMHRKGVRCTDCHDPHTTKLLASGNQLCNRCHIPAKYDTPAHHHHKIGSKGAQCVECHMPERTYMVVDPRRDHNIRVPRPDLSVLLGTPNACNGCHDDLDKAAGRQPHDAQWAADQIVSWFGPNRKEDPHYALAIAAGRTRELEKLPDKPASQQPTDPYAIDAEIVDRLVRVARRTDGSPLVRASAVSLLRGFSGSKSRETVENALTDKEPLVRVAAVRAVEPLMGIRANEVWLLDSLTREQAAPIEVQLEQLLGLLLPRLNDPIRAVRIEAARALSVVPRAFFKAEDYERFEAVLNEFIAGQLATADQAAAHLNLGVVYGNQRKFQKAEQEYRAALRLDKDFVPARVNLAMLYDHLGRKEDARRLFKEVIRLAPELAEAHYSLGLLVAEDPAELPQAARLLAEAARLSPTNARMHYNLGLAQQQLGDLAEAEKALRQAHKLDPRSADYLHALAILYAQQRNWPKSLACVEELVRLYPNQPGWQQLRQQLQQQSQAPQPIGPGLR